MRDYLNQGSKNGALMVLLSSLCLMNVYGATFRLENEAVRRSALDLAGHSVDPLNQVTNKAVVLIFVSCECPISNRYAPELRRLNAKFGARGMKFCLVYPNADEGAKDITR